jgi:hypothetical protein
VASSADSIGFDRFLDLMDAAQQAGTEDNYPPCNVERLGEDRYQISLAVAGFTPDEIAITAEQSVLTVEGLPGPRCRAAVVYHADNGDIMSPKGREPRNRGSVLNKLGRERGNLCGDISETREPDRDHHTRS